MIKAYPKIFAVGHKWVQEIFDGEVEITVSKDLYRVVTSGFPSWYKDKLMEDSFNENSADS